MKLYHGSPKSLKLIKPQQARGQDEFENQKAIFLADSFDQAALYAIGKTLKNKTNFALLSNKLVIVGNQKPSKGYVYTVNVNAKKGIWNQYSYPKIIKKFTKKLINPKDYKKNIIHVSSKEKLIEICTKEKRELMKNVRCQK